MGCAVDRTNVASGGEQLVEGVGSGRGWGGGVRSFSSEPLELLWEAEKVYKHTGGLCSPAEPQQSLFRVDVISVPLDEEKNHSYIYVCRHHCYHTGMFSSVCVCVGGGS